MPTLEEAKSERDQKDSRASVGNLGMEARTQECKCCSEALPPLLFPTTAVLDDAFSTTQPLVSVDPPAPRNLPGIDYGTVDSSTAGIVCMAASVASKWPGVVHVICSQL